jgi:hypothetical protein
MFSRIRVVLGIAFVLSSMISGTVYAKGGFDFITITGPERKEGLRVTDTALTEDFFTFANFYEDKTQEPSDPGEGYEILRYYVDGNREMIFDRLHYYPETGFVFYDGIENGESEYDGEWYQANPGIRTVFESALSNQAAAVAPPEKQEPVNSMPPSQPASAVLESSLILSIVIAAGVIALTLFALWRRKPSIQ